MTPGVSTDDEVVATVLFDRGAGSGNAAAYRSSAPAFVNPALPAACAAAGFGSITCFTSGELACIFGGK